MRFNLKNRPDCCLHERHQDERDMFACSVIAWFEGFEAEVRKILRGNRPYGPSPMVKELIKEILGE